MKMLVDLSSNQPRTCGKIGLERVREAVGDAHAVLHEVAPLYDQAAQLSHGDAVAAEWCDALGVTTEQVERELGVRGIVLGIARHEGLAVPSERARVDGEDDDEVVLQQRGDDGPVLQLDRDGDGCSAEALAQPVEPGLQRDRAMLDDAALELVASRHLEAHVVLLVGPVQTDECCELPRLFLLFLHATSLR